MDDRPTWAPEKLEALEALRSADEVMDDTALAALAESLEQDPQLSQRLSRILKWDQSIAEKMGRVPVPSDLAERIMAGLERPSPSLEKAPEIQGPRRRRRRTTWLAITAGAAAVAVLIGIAVLNSGPPELDPATLLSIAQERFEADMGISPKDQLVANNSPPPAGFPFGSGLKRQRGMTWRSVDDFKGASAIAYDIPLGPGKKATLYVVRCRTTFLPASPPASPGLQTRNLQIAAWQTGDVVYIAVVQGDEATYRYLCESTIPGLT